MLARNEIVAQALLATTYPRSVAKRVEALQVMINEDNDNWVNVLGDIEEPVILTALIWSWLDQLKVNHNPNIYLRLI